MPLDNYKEAARSLAASDRILADRDRRIAAERKRQQIQAERDRKAQEEAHKERIRRIRSQERARIAAQEAAFASQGVATTKQVRYNETLGEVRAEAVPQKHADGSVRYTPKDFGIEQTPQGPMSRVRDDRGNVKLKSPFRLDASKLGSDGRITAPAYGRGTEGMPDKDVTKQAAEGAASGDPKFTRLRAPLQAREQKIVEAAKKGIVDRAKEGVAAATLNTQREKLSLKQAQSDVKDAGANVTELENKLKFWEKRQKQVREYGFGVKEQLTDTARQYYKDEADGNVAQFTQQIYDARKKLTSLGGKLQKAQDTQAQRVDAAETSELAARENAARLAADPTADIKARLGIGGPLRPPLQATGQETATQPTGRRLPLRTPQAAPDNKPTVPGFTPVRRDAPTPAQVTDNQPAATPKPDVSTKAAIPIGASPAIQAKATQFLDAFEAVEAKKRSLRGDRNGRAKFDADQTAQVNKQLVEAIQKSSDYKAISAEASRIRKDRQAKDFTGGFTAPDGQRVSSEGFRVLTNGALVLNPASFLPKPEQRQVSRTTGSGRAGEKKTESVEIPHWRDAIAQAVQQGKVSPEYGQKLTAFYADGEAQAKDLAAADAIANNGYFAAYKARRPELRDLPDNHPDVVNAAKDWLERDPINEEVLFSTLNRFVQSAVLDPVADVLDFASVVGVENAKFYGPMVGLQPSSMTPEESAAGQVAGNLRNGRFIQADPRQQGTMLDQSAAVAGSMLPYVAGGAVLKGLGATDKSISIGIAALGAAQNGAQVWREARAAGLSEGAAIIPFMLAAGVGASEALSPALKWANRVTGPGQAFKRALVKLGEEAFEEGLQEGGSQLATNVVAQQFYDKNRDLFDEVASNAGYGGGAGALMSAITQFVAGVRAHGARQRLATAQKETASLASQIVAPDVEVAQRATETMQADPEMASVMEEVNAGLRQPISVENVQQSVSYAPQDAPQRVQAALSELGQQQEALSADAAATGEPEAEAMAVEQQHELEAQKQDVIRSEQRKQIDRALAAHEIASLPDEIQAQVADAAARVAAGNIGPEAQALLVNTAGETGVPFAVQSEDGQVLLTDEGLARIKEFAPLTAKILPADQAQHVAMIEAQQQPPTQGAANEPAPSQSRQDQPNAQGTELRTEVGGQTPGADAAGDGPRGQAASAENIAPFSLTDAYDGERNLSQALEEAGDAGLTVDDSAPFRDLEAKGWVQIKQDQGRYTVVPRGTATAKGIRERFAKGVAKYAGVLKQLGIDSTPEVRTNLPSGVLFGFDPNVGRLVIHGNDEALRSGAVEAFSDVKLLDAYLDDVVLEETVHAIETAVTADLAKQQGKSAEEFANDQMAALLKDNPELLREVVGRYLGPTRRDEFEAWAQSEGKTLPQGMSNEVLLSELVRAIVQSRRGRRTEGAIDFEMKLRKGEVLPKQFRLFLRALVERITKLFGKGAPKEIKEIVSHIESILDAAEKGGQISPAENAAQSGKGKGDDTTALPRPDERASERGDRIAPAERSAQDVGGAAGGVLSGTGNAATGTDSGRRVVGEQATAGVPGDVQAAGGVSQAGAGNGNEGSGAAGAEESEPAGLSNEDVQSMPYLDILKNLLDSGRLTEAEYNEKAAQFQEFAEELERDLGQSDVRAARPVPARQGDGDRNGRALSGNVERVRQAGAVNRPLDAALRSFAQPDGRRGKAGGATAAAVPQPEGAARPVSSGRVSQRPGSDGGSDSGAGRAAREGGANDVSAGEAAGQAAARATEQLTILAARAAGSPDADAQRAKAAEDYRAKLLKFIQGTGADARFQLGPASPQLVLGNLGEGPVGILPGVMTKARDTHGIPPQLLAKLPEQIHDPVAIFRSSTEADAMVILTEVPGRGGRVVAAVHVRESAGGLEINHIASIHAKDNESQIQAWVKQGLLTYVNTKKKPKWLALNTNPGLIPGVKGPLRQKQYATEADLPQLKNSPEGLSRIGAGLLPTPSGPSRQANTATEKGGAQGGSIKAARVAAPPVELTATEKGALKARQRMDRAGRGRESVDARFQRAWDIADDVIEKLAMSAMPQATAIARNFRNSGLPHEDLVQEASTALLDAAAAYNPSLGDFGPLAAMAVRNRLRKAFRQVRGNREATTLDTELSDGTTGSAAVPFEGRSPADEAARNDILRQIDEEVAKMPRHIRRMVELHNQGYTQQQIAEELGSTNQNISRTLARFGEVMRDRLAKRGVSRDEVGHVLAARVAAPPRPDESGFYSTLARAVETLDFGRTKPKPAKNWAGWLKKISEGRGTSAGMPAEPVRPEEIKWSGIMTWLKEQHDAKRQLTKADILRYLSDEGAVVFEEEDQVSHVNQADELDWEESGAAERVTDDAQKEWFAYDADLIIAKYNFNTYYVLDAEGDEISGRLRSFDAAKTEAKKIAYEEDIERGEGYGEYQLDEGHPYRVITLGSDSRISMGARPEVGSYESSHFAEVMNYIAHMRYNERPDASGRDGIFIEEIQSDRHQAGRKHGYSDVEITPREAKELIAKKRGITVAEVEEAFGYNNEEDYVKMAGVGVPDAPFRETWPLQMFKRALRDAVASGKSWVGWTDAKTQTDRYNLKKQVDSIVYTEQGGRFYVWPFPNAAAAPMIDERLQGKSADDMEDILGKDIVAKLKRGDGSVTEEGYKALQGGDLEIGKEGMTAFYNQMLPDKVGRYVAQWSGKVERGTVPHKDRDSKKSTTSPMWRVDITPEMRESVSTQGQMLFARVAIPTPAQVAAKAGDVQQATGKLLRKYFLSRGLLPKNIYDAKTARDGQVNSMLQTMDFLNKDLEKAIKQEWGGLYKIPAGMLEKMNNALGGGLSPQLLADIPARFHPILGKMRFAIDTLSRRMIADGVVEGELAAKVDRNMGLYLHRSYMIHDNPKWAKSVPDEIKNKAKAFIRSQMVGATEAEIDGAINELIYKHSQGGQMTFLQESKLGKKDLRVLKQRKDVPEPIRALLGEYTDPRANFSKSMSYMARLISNHNLLKEIRQQGLNDFLFEKPQGEYYAQIAGDNSETMKPINGLYTTPELVEAFTEQFGPRPSGEVVNRIYQAYLSLNTNVKIGKTVGSNITHIRNVLSNVLFMVANGHVSLNPKTMTQRTKDAIRALGVMFNATDSKVHRTYFTRLVRLGVLKDSAYAGELRDLLKDAQYRLESITSPNDGIVRRNAQAAGKIITTAYEAEDAFWKVIAFESERARYAKAEPNLSAEQLDRKAADIVRNTLPTYSKIPAIAQFFRKIPLTGAFVAFPMEVFRVSYHTIKLAKEELTSSNPAVRRIGAQRASGILVAGTITSIVSKVSMMLAGYGPEDDDDLRRFQAPWAKNSQFFYLPRAEDGSPRYVDMSYSDPYGMLRKIGIGAFRKNDSWKAHLWEGLRELTDPFLGQQIVAGGLMQIVVNNKDFDLWGFLQNESGGRPITSLNDEAVTQIEKWSEHLWSRFQPGAIGNATRLYKAATGVVEDQGRSYDFGDELIANIAGQRRMKLNLPQAIKFKAAAYGRAYRAAIDTMNDDSNNVSATQNDINAAILQGEGVVTRLVENFRTDVKAAMRLGVEPEVIAAAMSDARLPRMIADQAMTDAPIIVDLEPSERKSKLAAMGK